MMFHLREYLQRLWGTFNRRDRETDEELRFHLEMAEDDALRRGQSAREARLRAGSATQAAEAMRDQSVIGWLADFLRDSRHGIRLLAKSPAFTAAAIVSLSLGIGANTAIFSLIDAVVLRMMPVAEPEQLVQFGRDLSYPLFRQFGQELHCFTDMFAQASMGRRDVIFDEEPEAVDAEFVSGKYYSVLGISAFDGRTFEPEIDRNRHQLRVRDPDSCGSPGRLCAEPPGCPAQSGGDAAVRLTPDGRAAQANQTSTGS